jgi:hypothetical protein
MPAMTARFLLSSTTLTLVFAAIAPAGCAGGDSEEKTAETASGASTCSDAMTELCDMACACTGTDSCALALPQGDAGTAGISFKSKTDCLNLYVVLGCGYGNPTFDFDACTTALASAQCIPIGVAGLGSDKGLEPPSECHVTQQQ